MRFQVVHKRWSNSLVRQNADDIRRSEGRVENHGNGPPQINQNNRTLASHGGRKEEDDNGAENLSRATMESRLLLNLRYALS